METRTYLVLSESRLLVRWSKKPATRCLLTVSSSVCQRRLEFPSVESWRRRWVSSGQSFENRIPTSLKRAQVAPICYLRKYSGVNCARNYFISVCQDLGWLSTIATFPKEPKASRIPNTIAAMATVCSLITDIFFSQDFGSANWRTRPFSCT